jgi:hypothetical protein
MTTLGQSAGDAGQLLSRGHEIRPEALIEQEDFQEFSKLPGKSRRAVMK